MKSIEQLSIFPIEDPFKTGTEWMNKYPQQKKKKGKKGRKRIVNPKTYRAFYSEGIKLDGNIYEQTEEKLRLLTRYFKRQFGDDGREPLMGKPPYYIGAKFKHMLEAAIERGNIQ